MKSKEEIALGKFASGFNCSQSVVFAFAGEIGLDADMALKLATGFGGGMGRHGEVCGALSGGILVLGAKFGRGEQDGKSKTDTTYAKTNELITRFEKQHGTCRCRDLLHGCDLRTDEGQRLFKERELRQKVCLSCIKTVVDILPELLASPVESASH